MWIVIFKAKRTDCRYLSDVFAGLRPVEMPGFAWKNDDASRRIGLHLVAIEGLPEPDVKNARHDRVDAILWMLVRHQFRAVGHLDPDHVRTGFRGMAYKDRKTSPRRKRRERIPVDVFGQDHSKISLVRLMIAGHASHPFPLNASLRSGDQLHAAAIRRCVRFAKGMAALERGHERTFRARLRTVDRR